MENANFRLFLKFQCRNLGWLYKMDVDDISNNAMTNKLAPCVEVEALYLILSNMFFYLIEGMCRRKEHSIPSNLRPLEAAKGFTKGC